MKNYKQYPMRQMSGSNLSDELRTLERFGVEVPILNKSINSPRYLYTTDDSVEIYSHDGRELRVGPGKVIDSHGNVVNLSGLRKEKEERK